MDTRADAGPFDHEAAFGETFRGEVDRVVLAGLVRELKVEAGCDRVATLEVLDAPGIDGALQDPIDGSEVLGAHHLAIGLRSII